MAKEEQNNCLQPDFYEGFSCVGAACRHNCCETSWDIFIEKKIYKKYHNIREPKELADDLRRYVRRNEAGKNSLSYGKLKQLSDPVRCAFQTETGLCRIQKELGEEYLSLVCRTYPRIRNEIHNITDRGGSASTYEKGLCFSCEEVVRLLLHKKAPIGYKAVYTEPSNICNRSLHLSNRSIADHYHEIRAMSVALLQDEHYEFEDRLILLCIFFLKLDELEKDHREAEAMKWMRDFEGLVDSLAFEEVLHVKPTYAVSLDLAFNMLKIELEGQGVNEQIQKLFDQMTEVAIPYAEYVGHYKAFMKTKEYFLENIFVNQLFLDMLPFLGEFSLKENALYIAGLYAMYKLFIVGVLGPNKEMAETELIDCTAYYGKLITHNPEKVAKIIHLIEKNEMDTAAYLAIIIKG